MAVYPITPAPFLCAICNRKGPQKWQWAAMQDIPPLCWRCEQEYGVGPYGDLNPDRRVIKQISALAAAINIDAHRISIGEGPIHA